MEKYICKNKSTKYCVYANKKKCKYWGGKDCLITPDKWHSPYQACNKEYYIMGMGLVLSDARIGDTVKIFMNTKTGTITIKH